MKSWAVIAPGHGGRDGRCEGPVGDDPRGSSDDSGAEWHR